MLERFYVNCPLSGPVVLQGAEAHHLSAVRRLRAGQNVCLFNGDGREYQAEITILGRRQVSLNVLSAVSVDRELPFRLTVACPLPKGDRVQFLIEKLTELGVANYVPLQTSHSVIHPRENRTEKLQRHVIEASKQCGRNTLMKIGELAVWEDFAQQPGLPATRILAHPGGAPLIQESVGMDSAVAIGPEGGFREEEVERARNAGWQVVDLGPRILRIETAALLLAAALSRPAQAAPKAPRNEL